MHYRQERLLTALERLDFAFTHKPLLIGGMAMEYYGMRPAGADIDLVISHSDYAGLSARYPDQRCDLWGDLGVIVHGCEIWRSIALFGYDYLRSGATEHDQYQVISLDRLLFTRVLALQVEKYRHDLDLTKAKILQDTLSERRQNLSGKIVEQYAKHADLIGLADLSSDGRGDWTVSFTGLWKGCLAPGTALQLPVPSQVAADFTPSSGSWLLFLTRDTENGTYRIMGDGAAAAQVRDARLLPLLSEGWLAEELRQLPIDQLQADLQPLLNQS